MMSLIKRGFLYKPDTNLSWMHSHAYLPTPDVREDYIRIYLAFWDKYKVGRIGFIDVDSDDPSKILNVSKKPVLDIGSPGRFDDNGVSPSYILNRNGGKFLFYIGWQLGKTVPYYLFTGIASSIDNGDTFIGTPDVPYLDRLCFEPFVRSAPMCTIGKEEANEFYYTSATKWIWFKEYNRYWYDSSIMYLETLCQDRPVVLISLPRGDIFSFGRPWVIFIRPNYHMFFVYREITNPTRYKQGYASSNDGLNWEAYYSEVIPLGNSGEFDSDVASHLVVVPVKDRLIGIYMGNGFGEAGIGWCEVEIY